jgi:hypothetical protein
MNPQEKALDLFNKMKGFRVKHHHALKCARVAVAEVMQSHEDWSTEQSEWREEWKQVDEELLKLKQTI